MAGQPNLTSFCLHASLAYFVPACLLAWRMEDVEVGVAADDDGEGDRRRK